MVEEFEPVKKDEGFATTLNPVGEEDFEKMLVILKKNYSS